MKKKDDIFIIEGEIAGFECRGTHLYIEEIVTAKDNKIIERQYRIFPTFKIKSFTYVKGLGVIVDFNGNKSTMSLSIIDKKIN